jgi:hypothetical protein
VSRSPPADESFAWGLGVRVAVPFQPDQLLGGLVLSLRRLGLTFLEADISVVAGVGVEHLVLRPGVHVRAVVPIDDFRIYPTVGAIVEVAAPRGGFAEFCEKTQIDCSDVGVGAQLGLGAGWRWIALEALLGLGSIPLYDFTATFTWVFG